MIKLADYRTEKALPAEMRTPERIALSYAYDQQKKKFLERLQNVYIWADLENVDDSKLDFLQRRIYTRYKAEIDYKRYLLVHKTRNAPGYGGVCSYNIRNRESKRVV